MKKEDLICFLTEEMDEEILSRMPDWFKILRETYMKKFQKEFFPEFKKRRI